MLRSTARDRAQFQLPSSIVIRPGRLWRSGRYYGVPAGVGGRSGSGRTRRRGGGVWRGREKCRELEREVGWVWGGLKLGSERLEEGETLFIRLHQRDYTVASTRLYRTYNIFDCTTSPEPIPSPFPPHRF